MKPVSKIMALIALASLGAFGLWGCGSDDTPTSENRTVDTDAPEVVSATAVDASHVEVVFSEAVEKTSAEDTDNYIFIEGTTAAAFADAAPLSLGDTLWVAAAVLGGDGRTVTATTWNTMNDAPYDYTVTGVKDLSGNSITTAAVGGFDGSVDPDVTPPTIVSRTPASNATNVPLAQTVTIVFSEAMDYNSVVGAFTWTGAGPVSFDVDTHESNVFEFQPEAPLQQNTLYTVAVSGGAMDLAGVHLSQTSWSFRTTAGVDETAPTLVSTTPADGATSVSVSANLVLQFSEAVAPNSLDEIIVTPEIGDGDDSWSPDGATLTFNPHLDFENNTQYVMVLPEGGVTDLAGNPMEESIVVRFTTGASLESGRISGQLAGDPGTAAANPADAVVLISSVFLFDFEDEGAPPIEGAGIAGTSGVYSVTSLVDGTFWPVAMKETNGDGQLETEFGDAVGAYGIDFDGGDYSADSVTVASGAPVDNIDFPLFDPSAISGEVSYVGSIYADSWWQYEYRVGLFDRDPSGGGVDPVTGTPEGLPIGDEPDYVLHQIDIGFASGTYYVGAFLDLDFNGDYDAATEPAGFYMDGASLGTVTVTNGSDAFNVDIALNDPAGFAGSQLGWSIPPRDEALAARAEQWRQLREHIERVFEGRK